MQKTGMYHIRKEQLSRFIGKISINVRKDAHTPAAELRSIVYECIYATRLKEPGSLKKCL